METETEQLIVFDRMRCCAEEHMLLENVVKDLKAGRRLYDFLFFFNPRLNENILLIFNQHNSGRKRNHVNKQQQQQKTRSKGNNADFSGH